METKKAIIEAVAEYLAPLFGPATEILDDDYTRENFEDLAEMNGRRFMLRVALTGQPEDEVYLFRAIPFTETEQAIARNILEEWEKIFTTPHIDDYAAVCIRQAQIIGIAKILSPARHTTVLRMLNLLSFWSSETYEGDKISFCVGIDEDDPRPGSVSFFDASKEDYAKVLTSGCDTLLVCNAEGDITAYCEAALPAEAEAAHVYAPLAYLPVAYWTSQNRCAFCLSRNGDILIFKDRQLFFAKRRGNWLHFSHQAYLAELGYQGQGSSRGTIEALYLSLLDVSFRRKGACIGFFRTNAVTPWMINERRNQRIGQNISQDELVRISQDRLHGYLNEIVSQGDMLAHDASSKTMLLRSALPSLNFAQIPRKLRAELLSIDGATLIFDDGSVFAVGAILKIPGGSSSGGRRAAAMTLAEHGIGIKVSNDGHITAWSRRAEDGQALFEIG